MKKYLLYALGEILLIVVGILIALQINNWNERKKSSTQGKELLSEIKRGIDGDLKELDKFILNQEGVYKSQVVFSDWLKGKYPYSDTLDVYLARSLITTDYSINYSGYETLKKFGLKRIKNDSLRASISNLYEIKYPSFIKFSKIYQKFLDELLALNAGYFNELNYMKAGMQPIRPKQLKEDVAYAYHLNTLKNFNQLLIYQAWMLKKEMGKTHSTMK